MRKLVGVTTGALALVAFMVAPSVAQNPATSVKVTTKVTPNKAGTKKNPQGVRINVSAEWTSEAGFEPPIITRAVAFFPKGSLYNGAKYPKCSVAKANRVGPSRCPRKSIMGSASGVALADNVRTNVKITIINGGAREVCFYTVLNNPARVTRCVPGKVSKIRHPKWQYKLELIVPEQLQVVAGVPIALRSFTGVAGGKRYAKDWLATTGCPRNRKWDFEVETFYLYNDGSTSSSKYADSTPCRR